MVSICAGCNVMQPWGACVTGAVAGIVYLGKNETILTYILVTVNLSGRSLLANFQDTRVREVGVVLEILLQSIIFNMPLH